MFAGPRGVLAALLGVLGAGVGLALGYIVWVVLWSLPWFEDPWVIEDGTITINDPFEAIGKLITFLFFPAVAAFYIAVYAYALVPSKASQALDEPEANK